MQYSLNLGDIYAILTALSWSTAVILFEVAGRKLSSIQISLLKNIVGVTGFVLFIVLDGDDFPAFSEAEYLILIFSGFIGVALGDLCFLASLKKLGSGLSAIISTTYSVLIFLLAYLMYNESISLFSYLGGILVIFGVIIGTVKTPQKKSPKDLYLGILYGLIAQLFTAYSVLLLKPIMDTQPIIPIALIRFSIGIIFSAVVIFYLDGFISMRETLEKGFRNKFMVGGAFFGTFLSVIFWLAGFKYTLAGRAAIYNQLSTIFIILMAAVFLNEVMTKRKWLSVALAMTGALIVSIS